MTFMLTGNNVVTILKKVVVDFKGHSDQLRQLDAVIGDGDLGVTVELGSKALAEYLETVVEDDIGQLLVQCGLRFNKASPSTFGTLLASAFMGAGKIVAGKKVVHLQDLGPVADAAVEAIRKRGKADFGDKTMLDCLVPTVAAFKKLMADDAGLEAALQGALKAAEDGMKATIPMMARHGRASWHRENTIGVQDGGATAMYYLIESFVRHLITGYADEPSQ